MNKKSLYSTPKSSLSKACGQVVPYLCVVKEESKSDIYSISLSFIDNIRWIEKSEVREHISSIL